MARLIMSLICLFMFAPLAQSQAILPPPFGMQWGDTMDSVLDWAQSEKLDVCVEMSGVRPAIRVLRISSPKGSLPKHQAYALDARYYLGKLYEVTVHYGAAKMKVEKVREDFLKVKKVMAVKYGAFIPNGKQEKKSDGFVRKSISYHIEPVSGLLLLLAWSEVEDVLRSKHSARFSLLYRNENIIPVK